MNLIKEIKNWLQRKNLACEIKLLLDSSMVLGEDHLLTKSMLKAFQIEDEPERIDVIYLDTPARDCLKAGWVSRIRVNPVYDHLQDALSGSGRRCGLGFGHSTR